MDFNDSPDQAAFRAEVRAFLDANAPLRRHSSETPYGEGDDPIAVAKDWQKRLYDAGWACIAWPEAFGGRGATTIQSGVWPTSKPCWPPGPPMSTTRHTIS